MEFWRGLGEAGLRMQTKLQMRRWLLGLAMLFMLAGVYTPPQADAQVVVKVKVGGHQQRHYHHRYYRRHYRRHYRR
jgi:hypothetical protein